MTANYSQAQQAVCNQTLRKVNFFTMTYRFTSLRRQEEEKQKFKKTRKEKQITEQI